MEFLFYGLIALAVGCAVGCAFGCVVAFFAQSSKDSRR